MHSFMSKESVCVRNLILYIFIYNFLFLLLHLKQSSYQSTTLFISKRDFLLIPELGVCMEIQISSDSLLLLLRFICCGCGSIRYFKHIAFENLAKTYVRHVLEYKSCVDLTLLTQLIFRSNVKQTTLSHTTILM